MSTAALGLILASAVIHASWNLLAKRAGGGAAFVWLAALVGSLIWLPISLLRGEFALVQWQPVVVLFLLGSGVLQTLYFLTLQRGYQVGDLSVIYPLARGSGPLFAMLGAIFLLGERPTTLGLLGALLIVSGVFVIARGGAAFGLQRQALGYGLATGFLIAAYTLWDKVAVSRLQLPPVLYDSMSVSIRALLLLPVGLRLWPQVKTLWRTHKGAVIGVGFGSELAYILVLVAMQTTPLLYTAPLREVSILIATVMGVYLLHEGQLRSRLPAALAILLGVIALAAS